jgi:uncharacterized protein YyaL (SSP411 family)
VPNRLSGSTSPYLRQHAGNPVDWYEWGEDAFAEARRRQAPILLSVGYSACHWCHVMAHESFEDPETASVMNAGFVNIKVDREERPDVDAVYMEAVQATTGRGGWPMTVFMTPDGLPFYTGTYFPDRDRHGLPSFRRVMEAVLDAWTHRRQEVIGQGEQLRAAIDNRLPVAGTRPARESLVAAYQQLGSEYDPVNGGFGGAPKFPQQPVLEFLLRIRDESWAPKASSMLTQTLTRMARGGIYDQVGGGFARYTVDADWLVPHFEKMLYDNAQLARLYLWAGIEFGSSQYRQIAVETLEYLRRDLRHPDGAFFAAEDADSEGEEGRFYVWSHDEFHQVVGEVDGPVAARVFGITPAGNFEGSNILHLAMGFTEAGEADGRSPEEVGEAIARARRRLLEARSRRVRPGLDHKVVASWNGLAIRAFAEAGRALDRPDFIDDARRAARFVLERMRRPHGRLHRSWSEGLATVDGFLEDHASLAVGLFTLYAVTGEVEWFDAAHSLTAMIPEWFTDPEGGFYSTSRDAEALIKRPKDQMDNPLPSGNSLAAEALLLSSLYTGDPAARELVDGVIRAGSILVERYPSAVGHLLAVMASIEKGTRELAVVGPAAGILAAPAWSRYRPEMAIASSSDGSESRSVPLLADRFRPDQTLAYLCEGFVCSNPVSTAEALAALLESPSTSAR